MDVRLIPSSETRSLRHQVLWPHIDRMEACVIDIDDAPGAFHLGVYLGENLISIGSFFQMPSSKLELSCQYRLRAMATHPDYRGKHAGTALVRYGLQLLREKGVDVLWCDARERAVPFYDSLGFSRLPEVYDIPHIGPHYFMWKVISGQS